MSVIKKMFCATCIASCCIIPFFAEEDVSSAGQQPVVLSVDDAVAYAEKNSRTLKSAQIDLEMKKRADAFSWNVFVPSVSASATTSRANDYSPSNYAMWNGLAAVINPQGKVYIPELATSYDSEKDRWSAIGNVSVSLNLSLALIANITAVHANYEAGQISWQQTVKQNDMNVRKLFYGLLLQQESLSVQETSLENARQRAQQAEINYKNGIVPEISMLQAQVSYENQRPIIDKQKQQLSQQLDTFAFILGMPVNTKIQLQGEIKPVFVELNADDLYSRYGKDNMDAALLEKNIRMLKRQLGAVDLKSYTPALALSWNKQEVGSFSKDMSDSSNWYDNGSLNITLAWTLTDMLPFSANRQQAADIRDNVRKLEVQLETLRENNELSVKKTVDSLEQAHQAILSDQRNITLAQRSYDMTAVAYRNGTKELLDLRDAETQLNQAKLGMMNEQFNYISYMLDLEYTLNTDLSNEMGENK